MKSFSTPSSSLINSIVKPSCLIMDKISRCIFNRESTGLFFDMIDRRYEKEGAYQQKGEDLMATVGIETMIPRNEIFNIVKRG